MKHVKVAEVDDYNCKKRWGVDEAGNPNVLDGMMCAESGKTNHDSCQVRGRYAKRSLMS